MSHLLLVVVVVALALWVWVVFVRRERGQRRGPRAIVVHDHTRWLVADVEEDEDDEPTLVDGIPTTIALSYRDVSDG